MYTSTLFPKFVLFYLTLTVLQTPGVVGETNGLIDPLYYVFNTADSNRDACPTISSGVVSRHYVLQPGPSFTSRQSGTFSFSDTPFFDIENRTICCQDNTNVTCRVLTLVTLPRNPDFNPITEPRGVIPIQFTPADESTPSIIIRFRFGFVGFSLIGNSTSNSCPESSGDVLLQYEYRPMNTGNLLTPTPCELDSNGVPRRVDFVRARFYLDDRCLSSEGPDLYIVCVVQTANVTVPETKEVFLVPGLCTSSGPQSSPVNVTLRDSMDPPDTSPEPATDDSLLDRAGVIIILIVAVIIVLFIIIAVIIIVVVVFTRKKCLNGSNGDVPIQLNNLAEVKDDDATLEHVYVDSQVKKATKDYDLSSVAFVTAEDTTNYQELTKEILVGHDCERIQPVSTADGFKPTLDDFCVGIARCLRKEKCLVYIIWSEALESMNDKNYPPMKNIIRTLVNRPLLSSTATRSSNDKSNDSVMHRLVLFQLGSKDKRHQTTPLGSSIVSWDMSVHDINFDAKQCGEYVCNIIKERFKSEQDFSQTKTSSHTPGSKVEVSNGLISSSNAAVLVTPPPPYEEDHSSTLNPNTSTASTHSLLANMIEDQTNKIKDAVREEMENANAKVIKKVDKVIEQTDFINTTLINQALADDQS